VRRNLHSGIILECGNRSNIGMDTVTLLSPTQVLFRLVGMASWGVIELEKLCSRFGKNKKI
jgi:hypothetical protein